MEGLSRKPYALLATGLLVLILGVILALVLASPEDHHRAATTVAPATTAGSPGLTPLAQSGTLGLKPQLIGLVDQHKLPIASYRAGVPGSVVEVLWRDVQPVDGSHLVTGVIDQAIAQAAQSHIELKLDLLAGQFAPTWVMNLPVSAGQAGPFRICNDRGVRAHCAQVGHFWETNYEAAYSNYQRLLADRYDGSPQIRQIDITGCMTIFEEPLLRQADVASNVDAYAAAGFSELADEDCERTQIRAHAVWQRTQSAIALNPYQRWTGNGFTTDEKFTESLMDYCRQTLRDRCVLGNDSAGKQLRTLACPDLTRPTLRQRDAYGRMYTKMKCLGRPLFLRTATPDKILASGSTLAETIDWGSSLGAGSIELPEGYDQPGSAVFLKPAELEYFDSQLRLNAEGAPQ